MSKKIKKVAGVGINDANYAITKYAMVDGKRKKIWECPIYRKWFNLLQRCYHVNSEGESFFPNYVGHTVDPRWYKFSDFKAWVEAQVGWESMELDKDLLVPGNTVYGPDTCIFVPKVVNTFVTKLQKNKAGVGLPKGVSHSKSKKPPYTVTTTCATRGLAQQHSKFKTVQEAHLHYLEFKMASFRAILPTLKDERVALALARYMNDQWNVYISSLID